MSTQKVVGFTKTFRPVLASDSAYKKSRIVYDITPKEPVRTKVRQAEVRKTGSLIRDAGMNVREPGLPEVQREAIAALPDMLQDLMREVASDRQTNGAIQHTMERWNDFGSPTKAMIVGAYMDEAARRRVNDDLDARWSTRDPYQTVAREIVVGSGIHAAIYCAVRVRNGFPPPLVLESRDRAGGVFAISRGPSFYLNSRNRPGPLSTPGGGYALNYLPGAPIQPSDLSSEEYQTNEALAWAIRITLAMNADVATNAKVVGYGSATSAPYAVELQGGTVIPATRIIFATGLGKPRNITKMENDRIISFDALMKKMGDPFPLKGMTRVAVVGGGDSGKTAIESLCGQGPRMMSVASADWPEMIDWYGAPWDNCLACTQGARTRYKMLGSLLPDPSRFPTYRVTPMPATSSFSAGYETVYVNQTPYDYLIDATGYEPEQIKMNLVPINPKVEVVNEVRVGVKLAKDIYLIGPASDLAVTPSEQQVLRNIEENKTSIFRYATRTATLAASLP